MDVLVEAVVLGDGLDVCEAAAVDVAEEQLVGRVVARHEHVLGVQGGVGTEKEFDCKGWQILRLQKLGCANDVSYSSM